MNSVGSQRDLVTMVHEGGHAIHSFLCRNLELTEFKSTPSEVAELASMAMELLSMDYWDTFYENENTAKIISNNLFNGLFFVVKSYVHKSALLMRL